MCNFNSCVFFELNKINSTFLSNFYHKFHFQIPHKVTLYLDTILITNHYKTE
ncbi:hypothetical protein MtrunA17_Chr6g0486871 [Medicago truncatula]|uniref:Uncharacterized protein n=1 Tax=Medicago truncatula TaxID=3880 RepID=A0A396HI57_MEDTR|nr:hypothetical protein MtrunA17_Chr6g0486871 [Medicago truncatula]